MLFLRTVRERLRQGIWIKAPLLLIVLGLVVNQLLPDRPTADPERPSASPSSRRTSRSPTR